MDEVIQALNSLLEAERAAVEALVDLTRMSADIGERERLQQIGGEEAWACASLREQIETLGGTPSRRIGPLLAQLRAREHFGARLHVFVQQQQAVLEHIRLLQKDQQVPEDVGGLLAELYRIHASTIAWCEQRAAAFGTREAQKDADVSGRSGEVRPSTEGRETPHRGRNRRQAGYENRRSEASRAESSLPQQVNTEGSGPGPTF
jgi:bacterioferritin (cytochrome b1)